MFIRGHRRGDVMRIRRWFYSWHMFARAIHMARRKKHGAGRMPWRNAVKMGLAYRWIVYGQFYNLPYRL